MSWGVVIISIVLACFFHGEIIGKLFMFLAFINIMCSLFGTYIPFSRLIVEVSNFISVIIMIGLGALFIFTSGSNKKDRESN